MIEEGIFRSNEDRSINFVNPTEDGGAIEARFVQRLEDTIIVYLSSASGCALSCRMCHLTQTGQTMSTYVDVNGYLDQAMQVLEFVQSENKLDGVKTVHFNFMARGDALDNPHFVRHFETIILGLGWIARKFNLNPKFKISTIFPKTDLFGRGAAELNAWVKKALAVHPEVEFYYSLYSLRPSFRKRWIPKAFQTEWIGEAFCGTVGRLRLHHALIELQNTLMEDIADISRWLERHKIKAHMNLVSYNPFDKDSGEQAAEDTVQAYRERMEAKPNILGVHQVSPVARDVKAACGMFVS